MPLTQTDLDHILKHTAPLWLAAKNKRFFITGGTGLIGKWLLESFAYINRQFNLNCQMLVISRSPEKFIARFPHFKAFNDIKFLKGDVCRFQFPDEKFDYIIHAAAEASATLNADQPLEMMDTIIQGTKRTLDFVKHCGAKKLLFLSSGAVYGKQPDNLPKIPESYNGAPDSLDTLSAYGQAKRTAELLCGIYYKLYGIEISIARCFALVGPYLNLNIHYAMGNFIRDALKGEPVIVNGDGTLLRSYLYAADLAIWLWTMLFKAKAATAYNVGSDIPISIADLAHKIAELAPQKCSVKISKKPDLITERQKYIPDIDKAKNDLNLKCLIDLDEAVKRTISFYKK